LPLAQSDFYSKAVALEANVLTKNIRNLGKKRLIDYFKFIETMNWLDAGLGHNRTVERLGY
jgi:hypothetical protein